MRIIEHLQALVANSPMRPRSGYGALALLVLFLAATGELSAEADGPDYFRVEGISAGGALSLRSGPSTDDARIGTIPADGDGLRNLGCIGGMSAEEWARATPAEREAAARSRWCRVGYQGTEGWVAGWFLAEGSAPQPETRTGNDAAPTVREAELELSAGETRTIEARIAGAETLVYRIEAIAGERLSVALESDNDALSLDILASASGHAVMDRAGESETPESWSAVLRNTGSYALRVFLLPRAAAGGEAANFEITLGLAPPAEADFDATALVRCWLQERGFSNDCAVGVYRGASTRTLYLQRPGGRPAAPRVLVFGDAEIRSVPRAALEAERTGDVWAITVEGLEHYVIPDALLGGG